MNIEYLYNMSEEEKKQFPLTSSLINELVDFNKERHFDERGELLERLEDFFSGFSDFSIELFIKCIMLGQCSFPLPNVVSNWADEEIDVLHKRYKILKKLNKLTK